nr:NB-ARC domains-containing protein [Tanacetum cinerariifolium]
MAQEVVTSLVGNVVNKLFGIAKKEISYMSNCSENIEDLKRENEKLTQMRGRVQQQITVANNKGDRLLDDVAWSHDSEGGGEDRPLHTMDPAVAWVALLTEAKANESPIWAAGQRAC